MATAELTPVLITIFAAMGVILTAIGTLVKSLVARVTKLEGERNVVAMSLSEAEDKIEKLEQEIAEEIRLRRKAENDQLELAEEKQILVKRVAEMKVLQEDQQTQINTLKGSVEGLTSERAALQTSIQQLREDLVEEQRLRQETAAKLQVAEEAKEALRKASEEALEGMRRAHASEIEQLNNEIHELKRQITILQADLEDQRRNLLQSQEVKKVEVHDENPINPV